MLEYSPTLSAENYITEDHANIIAGSRENVDGVCNNAVFFCLGGRRKVIQI